MAASVLRQRHDKHTSDRNRKKKTILTDDQNHRNDITNGQRVSRYSSRPDVFFHRTFFKTITDPHFNHIAKSPQANATTKALPKSATLPTRTELLDNYILFFEINLYFSGK